MTLAFMWVGFLLFSRLTPFNIGRELERGNRAVGSMVMGMFIGVGIAVGLVIGMSLN